MSSHDYPILKLVGELEPDKSLLKDTRLPHFEWGGFTNPAEYPAQLGALLKKLGYEFDDYGNGMLFASRHSVPMHCDEKPSVIWVLKARKKEHDDIQLIVSGEFSSIDVGQVYLVNTTHRHALLSIRAEYVLFSAYISQLPPDNLSTPNTNPSCSKTS